MSLATLFLIAALGVFSASAEVMFSAKATVRVANGYYNATVYYLYRDSEKGKTYLRYDYTNPTEMIDLIDYTEGKRYKVCTKCEAGFYAYPEPALFKQTTDTPTGRTDGQCKEYIPADRSGVYSIWYKDDGTLCQAELADGKTLILTNFKKYTTQSEEYEKYKGYFDLTGKQCPAPVCKRVMDLVFVLDKSGSICGGGSGKYLDRNGCDLGNWIKIQDFVVSIVESFDVGTDASMIGIVTFSNGATKVSGLSANKQAIIDAMRGAQLTRYITCTGCGIDMAMDILKSTTTARNSLDPEKVLIVMTDGASNYYYGNPCAYYRPKCTKPNKNKCIRWGCPGGYKSTTSECSKYEETTTCKKYKCDKCRTTFGACIKNGCTKRNTSNCVKNSDRCQTAYPSSTSYCKVVNGVVVNQRTSTVYCMCGTYECAEYQCVDTKCLANECSDCEKYSTTECVEYEKKCVEMSISGTCNGQQECLEYECNGGEAECVKNIKSEYAMITGAINRTRTQWALWPASKRLPIVMVIGVTRSVSKNELNAIASTLQGKSLVYNVMTFNDLKNIISDLVDETCVSQTENLELCDDNCHGFCGCNKECYCPTCDNATGSCYSIKCDSDGKTSTGCVATHKTCEYKGKCIIVKADNETDGCCDEKPRNCKKSDSKCRIYGCNKDEGCTDDPVVCTPSSACFNVTCDPSKGCVETPACPDLGPCKIMSCSANGNTHKCTYTDKCSSTDPCRLPVCNEDTGECSTVPMVCTPKNGCYEAHCYNGTCIDEVNVTKSIECSSLATGTCEEGYCDLETGICKTQKIEDTDSCENCGQNKTLGCDERVDECATYKCAAGDADGSEYPTKCVEKDNRCFSNNPCVTKTCVAGKCITSTPCRAPKDACETVKCVADPSATLGYRCESSTTVPVKEDPCWRYSCNATSGTPIKESKCKQSKCTEFVGCAIEGEEAKCSYNQNHNCTSNMCNIITCNDETGQCETVENKTECNKYACKAYVCHNATGCDYSNITCDDNNPCTIDLCLSLDEYSSSEFDDNYTSENITEEFYIDSPDSLPHVCVHIYKCPITTKFCERSSCNVFGNCSLTEYACEDLKPNDTCHTYKCNEEDRKCDYVLLPEALLDVCGSCLKSFKDEAKGLSDAKFDCIGNMKMPEFAAAIGGAAVAGIVIAAIVVAAILGVSSALGTKELIKRAKKNADVGTNSNPLYEGNDNEASNPAFTGEN